ncbi:hypothetical protein RND71_040291 [Anisodus tanguticus]|uniref:Deoxyuridine 5'-triphosphate nucleotidohydrolase n=1 Tax=Anisodus tanguticus TaxID=243964 RepID=A0AAE1UVL3_9SOLA|nr:hypothetical protein RND71_040291 [Anisodus tanguticus]
MCHPSLTLGILLLPCDYDVADSNRGNNFLHKCRAIRQGHFAQKNVPHSADYDLFSARDVMVSTRGKAKITTDLSIYLPPGTYGRVVVRSSVAWDHSIDVGGGVVDLDKNLVFVILFNHSDIDFEIKVGDNITELVIELHATPEVVEVYQ